LNNNKLKLLLHFFKWVVIEMIEQQQVVAPFFQDKTQDALLVWSAFWCFFTHFSLHLLFSSPEPLPFQAFQKARRLFSEEVPFFHQLGLLSQRRLLTSFFPKGCRKNWQKSQRILVNNCSTRFLRNPLSVKPNEISASSPSRGIPRGV